MTLPDNQRDPFKGVSFLGRRLMAGLIDLVIIPACLAFFLWLLTAWSMGPGSMNFFFFISLIIWVLFRDTVYSPGRAIFKLKLVSLSDEKITYVRALQRNLLIILPFIGLVGYLIEALACSITGDRIMDRWSKTRVIDQSASLEK